MVTGGMSEAQIRELYPSALGLDEHEANQMISEMWDAYCGELNVALRDFAAGLRPRFTTAILSNSADGARREEQRRYGFEELVDVIVYSHEVGVAKPDPAIFGLTRDRLGVQSQERQTSRPPGRVVGTRCCTRTLRYRSKRSPGPSHGLTGRLSWSARRGRRPRRTSLIAAGCFRPTTSAGPCCARCRAGVIPRGVRVRAPLHGCKVTAEPATVIRSRRLRARSRHCPGPPIPGPGQSWERPALRQQRGIRVDR